ncbi:hypothetical protein [Volucribacter amazonae]|uniref:Uncharacterized protein n=1 Tax=Volucribacter amazonae TaxID=256731 RepID=A0A9X4PRA0_9PAST|nr:hypothetical protein [Volucribacter amazonae]MDG6896183.1 hypothetical protein [Volucribacter amazonae]
MKSLKDSMWRNKSKLTLKDLLKYIPDNHFIWYIYELDAIGIAPQGLSMPDFEDIIINSQYGYQLSWADLNELANNLLDINDCLITANVGKISYDDIKSKNNNVLYKIEITDSTYWEINLR